MTRTARAHRHTSPVSAGCQGCRHHGPPQGSHYCCLYDGPQDEAVAAWWLRWADVDERGQWGALLGAPVCPGQTASRQGQTASRDGAQLALWG